MIHKGPVLKGFCLPEPICFPIPPLAFALPVGNYFKPTRLLTYTYKIHHLTDPMFTHQPNSH